MTGFWMASLTAPRWAPIGLAVLFGVIVLVAVFRRMNNVGEDFTPVDFPGRITVLTVAVAVTLVALLLRWMV